MDDWDSRASTLLASSENTCSLMGSESYLSGYYTEAAVKFGMPSSSLCDGYENYASGNIGMDLEGKDERSNALGPVRLVEAQEVSIKEEHKNVEVEEPSVFVEEEQYDFPELSLLGGDCMVNSSNIGIGAEVEYLSRMFGDGRDCTGCENSFLVSLSLDNDGSLVGVDGDLVKHGDGFCCPHLPSECTIAAITSKSRPTEGRKGSLSNVESYKSNFDDCSDNVTNLDSKSKDYNELLGIQNDLGLPLRSSRKLKETCQVNNFTSSCEIETSRQKVEEEILGVSHIDHEASCSAQGSTSEPAYCSAVERCTSENLSFGQFYTKGISFDSFRMTSACCSIDNDGSTEEEIFPGVANSISLTSIRRTNPKRAASLRNNLADVKPIPLIRTQNDGRKYRRKFCSSTSCTSLILKMCNGVNRKIRTHRKPRLSGWGTVESLFTIMKQRDKLIKHNSVPDAVRRSRWNKAGGAINRRKRAAALKNKQFRLSLTKIPLPCQSIQPSMLLAEPSLEIGIENIMSTSDCHTGISDTKVNEQNLAGKWYAAVRSSTRERQQEEKDLESTLTQETSSDNLLSECLGVSSGVDLEYVTETTGDEHPSDPGNSPDSDVYNPVIDGCNISFDGSSIALNINSQVQELKEEDGSTSVAPNFIEPFVAHLPLLTMKMQASKNQRRNPMRGHKGKKKLKEKKGEKEDKGKNERIGKKTWISGSPFVISDSPPGEERLDCQAKSNEIKKVSLSSSSSVNCKKTRVKGGKCSRVSRKLCKLKVDPEPLLMDSSVVTGVADLNELSPYLKAPNRTVTNSSSLQHELNEQLEEISPSVYGRECHVRESTQKSLSKNKLNSTDSKRHIRKFIYDGKIMKSVREADVFSKENGNMGFSSETTNNESLLGAQMHGGTVAVDELLKDVTSDVARPTFGESIGEQYNILSGQSSFSGKKAWALCDDCQKWRCVPDELVHVIEKGRWTCKDNVDEAFADCTIPQEKTDEDINNDLGISDEQFCSTTLDSYGELALLRPSAAARTAWTPIKSNLFLHRSRRTQTIDEIMVCHCKPPLDGGLGCGEECLNRMLNIECVKGTCPCGSLCSNQQFQKRKYAKFKWLKCGKKGYGLQLEHNASRGQFLIEYVGEVLDLAAYEARLRYYAGRGQKHFYFMTLNGGEVIDACDKGNLGRFINHSCDPNCRTEKWMVNGEVCIGLFALRDIKKDEEITFDYNYVRVFGAAAKKCVCGSAECRGYIGGDPSSSEVIVQDDSDVEELEPVMIENNLGVKGTDSVATASKVANHGFFSVERNGIHVNHSISEQEVCVKNNGLENQDAIHHLSPVELSDSPMLSSCVELESNTYKLPDILPSQEVKLDLSSIGTDQTSYEDANEGPPLNAAYRSLPHGQLSESSKHSLITLQPTDHAVHGPVLDDATNDSCQSSCSFVHKSSSSIGPTEEILTASNPDSVEKNLRHTKVKRSRVSIRSVASGKTKKVSTVISSRHIEGVEEKLNELLDEDGGICRKKDAAKGYLKLLVVTAAAGDENKGSMSQSARDLSLILDAILKTKSRMVLVDIINKNGLQMLHNIMKQNRDNFNRIPILRKLLKVLEFLAEKEILTIDHIHAAPPRSGMESFKESMLKLMKHRDIQAHHIARNFADQWIPRNYRRAEPSDRDGRQPYTNCSRSNWCQALNSVSAANCQPSSEVDIHGEAVSLPAQAASTSTDITDITLTEMAKTRKRKTRWDQPSDVSEQTSEFSADQLTLCGSKPTQLEPIPGIEVPKQKSATQSGGNNSTDEIVGDDDGDDDDEMPPGFGSSCEEEARPVANASADISGAAVAVGHPQERYLPYLPVAYGMPITLMQQQGMDLTKCSNLFDSSLEIAPAMPFKPFPPLPSYPRQGPCPPNAVDASFNGNCNYRQDKERAYGNGRRIVHPRRWNDQRPRRF